jgi:hypothetical protein
MFQQSLSMFQLNQMMQQNLMNANLSVPGQFAKSSMISQNGLGGLPMQNKVNMLQH